MNNASILRKSLQPIIPASLILPPSSSNASLTSSRIVVSATSQAMLLEIQTNHPDGGSFGAGEELQIILHFSSIVEVVFADKIHTPFFKLTKYKFPESGYSRLFQRIDAS